jgi:hypothetical protein
MVKKKPQIFLEPLVLGKPKISSLGKKSFLKLLHS